MAASTGQSVITLGSPVAEERSKSEKKSDMPFIIFTSADKPSVADKKLIRSHVRRGQTRGRRGRENHAVCCSTDLEYAAGYSQLQREARRVNPFKWLSTHHIERGRWPDWRSGHQISVASVSPSPRKAGSGLAFYCYAAELDPPAMDYIFRCKFFVESWL